MKHIIGAISVLALSLPIAVEVGQAETGTPAQQYAANLEEYRPVSGGMRTATSDLERKASVERLAAFPPKLLELADKYPSDPIALKALYQAVQIVVSTDLGAQNAWEINQSDFPSEITDGSAGRTVAIVLRDHVLSDKLGPVKARFDASGWVRPARSP